MPVGQFSGAVKSRTALTVGTRLGALAVNTSNGHYLVVGGRAILPITAIFPITTTDGAELDSAGYVISSGFITSSLNTVEAGVDLMALAYSPASGTFLLAGTAAETDYGGRMLELNQHGVALSAASLPGQWPAVTSHATTREWLVGVSDANGTFIITSATPFGGSDAMLGGCTMPDPFVTIGGGTCVNGGWLLRGMIGGPVAAPGTCATPDPFVSLGGGTCVNGGWLPPSIVAPAPPTLAPGCASPQPGAEWVCVNGGWVPPNYPSGQPPNASCTIPDPFTAIGGGECVNGGWVPRREL